MSKDNQDAERNPEEIPVVDVGEIITVAAVAGFAASEAVHCGNDPVAAIRDTIEASGLPYPLRRQIALHVARGLQAINAARRRALASMAKQVPPTIH